MPAIHPEGNFTYPVHDGYLGQSRFGKEAVVLTFQTPHGDITWEGELEGEWLGKTLRSLRVAGFTGVDLDDVTRQLIRKPIDLWIRHKASKKGNLYCQVMISNKTGGSTRYDGAKSKAISGSLRGAIMALDNEGLGGEAPFDVPSDDDDGSIPR